MAQSPVAPHLLTARAAAERLGVAERTIRRAIARGDLRAVKRSGAFQIAPAELERFRARRFRSDRAATGQDESSSVVHLPGQPLAKRGSLPVPFTSLVGRESEIAALMAMLRGRDRLLTLTGPGGVGKTRLAVAAAAAVAADFADDVSSVALGAISDPRLVPQTIAHVLGIYEAGGESIETQLEAALRDRRLLLVLDNFEHVVESAPLLAKLLTGCPHLVILATSRVRLRLSGERERAVPPLPVSGVSDRNLAASQSSVIHLPSPAVELFVERAHAVREDLDFTAEQETLEAICQRLDGLPLAIELAAAWVNVLPPRELLARLERRLPLLTGGPRDVPNRLRTMRNAIAWSYDLLTAAERESFCQMAVFVGGFTLEAASVVLSAESAVLREGDSELSKQHAVLNAVASLVDKSLLRVEVVAAGKPRYGMLETIREYGLERLAASGQEAAVRQRHAAWALHLAEHTGPLVKGPDSHRWLEVLERDHANLRAALRWLAERRDGERLGRLTAALWPFWEERAYFAEGRDWLEAALEIGLAVPARDRLRMLSGAGTLAWRLSDFRQAIDYHDQTLTLARELGDRAAEAFALNNLGAQAKELAEYDRATAYFNASLAISRAIGAPETMVMSLHNLAQVQRLQRDSAAALRSMEEVLDAVQTYAMSWLLPSVLAGLGLAATDEGDHSRAIAHFHEGLSLAVAKGNRGHTIEIIECLARLAALADQAEEAARLFGAGEALRAELQYPITPADHAYTEPILHRLQETLSADGFAAAWARGRQLSWDAAVTAAFALCAASTRQRPGVQGLTKRELEILRLLAAGLSNRAIGERLFISTTTVASHVVNIYNKLDIDSRAKATAFAHQHDLT